MSKYNANVRRKYLAACRQAAMVASSWARRETVLNTSLVAYIDAEDARLLKLYRVSPTTHSEGRMILYNVLKDVQYPVALPPHELRELVDGKLNDFRMGAANLTRIYYVTGSGFAVPATLGAYDALKNRQEDIWLVDIWVNCLGFPISDPRCGGIYPRLYRGNGRYFPPGGFAGRDIEPGHSGYKPYPLEVCDD